MTTLPLLFCVLLSVPLLTEAQIGGGWSDASPTDPDVLKVAKAALTQKNKSSNGLKIISVRSQVVAGMNYDIKFTYDEGGNDVHEMKVYSVPWEGKIEVTEFN
ncbi:hypothetical protein QR680_004861 [Steinernema hermaphroditum]|uniref:Cystatin domain-containing protein n=1 Tax=Steinernema hermaphroditum TaxID=289476 RepID=A0AA39HQ24_9BILA|nr:hypothetical protein QR680_004861 [Steinernema hermaphroditum]